MPFSPRTSTNVLLSITFVALAAIGAVTLREVRQLAERDHMVAHTFEVLEASARLRTSQAEAVAARRGYILFGRDRDRKAFEEARAAVPKRVAELRRLTADNPRAQEKLDALEPLVTARMGLLERSIALHASGAKDSAEQVMFTEQGVAAATEIEELVGKLESGEQELLRRRTAAAERSVWSSNLLVIVSSLSALVLVALGFWVVNRALSRRERAEEALAAQKRLLQAVFESTGDHIIVGDSEGRIVLRNSAAAREHEGIPVSEHPQDHPEHFGLFKPDTETLYSAEELPLTRAARGEKVDNVEVYIRPLGKLRGRWFLASGRPIVDEAGKSQGGVVILRDVNERKLAELERENLLKDLQSALADVKTLSRLLPICASCKKIRDDADYWRELEDYLRTHSEVKFSHGFCPDCLKRLYPDLNLKTK